MANNFTFPKKNTMFIVHKPFFLWAFWWNFISNNKLVLSQVELDVIPLTHPNGFYQVMFTIEKQLSPHSWFTSQVKLAQEKVEGEKGHLSNLEHTSKSYLNKTPKPGLKYLVHQAKHIIWWNHGLIIFRLYWGFHFGTHPHLSFVWVPLILPSLCLAIKTTLICLYKLRKGVWKNCGIINSMVRLHRVLLRLS